MSFVHLHNHSMYSILDGMSKMPDMIARCKELGMTSIALTDHGVMYGIIDFYHACKNAGINPILGFEAYVAPVSRFEKKSENRYNHLVLLAENEEGLYNIQKLCTEGFKDGYYYKPRIDDELLRKYHKGVIALSACLAGRIPQLLLKNHYNEAKKAAEEYRELFGENNFFLEMQDHGIPDQKFVNQGIIRISKETGIPLVATNDAHYVYETDAEAHDVLLAMQQKTTLSDANRLRDNEKQYYIKSEQEMMNLFYMTPEAIENTQKIADRCKVEITFHETKMPAYPVPDGYTAFSYLKKLCFDGLKERYQDPSQKIIDQTNYELSTIKEMGFIEYFLIVWDYVNYCKKAGIPVGPGRGSGAGSRVLYALGVTDIDPERYDLQFERFLNPERVSMPDIDIDFCYRRRGEVIEHVKELYGKDNVCQIITIGTMAAKAAIKDTGKVLGYDYALRDSICKMIPNDVGTTIKSALDASPDLKAYYLSSSDVKLIIDTAMRLEGLPKSTGTHAAGVIIGAKPIEEYIPLAKNNDDNSMVSQYTMTTVEELGLLKMDFLGLRTLTVESDAIESIYKRTGEAIDINSIDIEDEEVYKYISTGQTNGIFQLESKGMQDFMTKLRPQSLEDLIAGISLYRPGPMEFIPKYIDGKNSPESIMYECKQLKPILKNTYGCIVYQEQVTKIVRDLAGYTMGQADNIRRAMSKKKQYVIDEERKSFIYGDENRKIPGCIANGIPEDVANRIYDSMVDFAKYAFNKSHAACYAAIGYQTAWLMWYYPIDYWAAIMTSVIGNSDKLAGYIYSAKKAGIKVLPPSLNQSTDRFVPADNAVLYAMSGIKGISENIAASIANERELSGKYRSFEDAVKRLSRIGVSKDGIANLIKCGAFDEFKGNRRQFLESYKVIMDGQKKELKTTITGQMTLFDIGVEEVKFKLPRVKNFPKKICLEMEKEVSGVYITGHPLDEKMDFIKKYSTVTSEDFSLDENGICSLKQDQKISICALITEIKHIYTKNNDKMAFVTLEDLTGTINAIVFPKIYAKYNCEEFRDDDQVYILGHITIDDERGISVIIDEIKKLDEIPQKLWIKFKNMDLFIEDQFIQTLPPGKNIVIVYIEDQKVMKELKDHVYLDSSIIEEITEYYGEENIAIKL